MTCVIPSSMQGWRALCHIYWCQFCRNSGNNISNWVIYKFLSFITDKKYYCPILNMFPVISALYLIDCFLPHFIFSSRCDCSFSSSGVLRPSPVSNVYGSTATTRNASLGPRPMPHNDPTYTHPLVSSTMGNLCIGVWIRCLWHNEKTANTKTDITYELYAQRTNGRRVKITLNVYKGNGTIAVANAQIHAMYIWQETTEKFNIRDAT